jgi:5-methyltetrahydropteroyltriglutamate--homocysteine methyltransferase
MRRSTDRILTTHVGSLIRPKALLEQATAARQQPAQQPRYQQALQQATAEVVRQQLDAGLDIVNDGEYGKSSWANYVLDRMTGFEFRPDTLYEATWLGRDRFRFAEFMTAQFPRGANGAPGHACVGPIRYQGHEAIRRNISDLKAAMESGGVTEGFLTAVAPASTGYDASNEYYKGRARLCVRHRRSAARRVSRDRQRRPCPSGRRCGAREHVRRDRPARAPRRYQRWAELRVDALNHALRDIPEERVRYHVCFGSWHVPHVADAPLEAILPLVLKVRAGAYSIEAANVRHEHEWRVWQTAKLAPGKILIPGVVTHHTTSVEHPRLVADRIVRFASLVGRENVIAGTDCGFAQLEQYQRVHPQVMWAKLQTLAEGARIASDELWGVRVDQRRAGLAF